MPDDTVRPSRRDLRRVRDTWQYLGRVDPFWAVMAAEGKRGGGWDPVEFFATGRAEVEAVLAEIEDLLPDRSRALDFGCGVGRLTQALARQFERVDGVDVAATMLELARRHDRSGGRCRFHLNPRADLALFEDGTFDPVYSNITLQHMPPPLARCYIEELIRVLRPGGLAVFQLAVDRRQPGCPTRAYLRFRSFLRRRAPRWSYRLYRRVVAPGEPIPPPPPGDSEMQMYSFSTSRVIHSVESTRGRLLEVRLWGDLGSDRWDSYRYIVQR